MIKNLYDLLNTHLLYHFYMIDSFQNDDDFLAVLILMGGLFFILAIIIGVVLILLFFLILFALISGSIISASVLIGLQQKSVSKGFRIFFLSVSILGSTVVSVIFFWAVNSIKDWWPTDISIIAGIICGVISGWLLGLLVFKATRKFAIFLKDKYNGRTDVKSIN